MDDRNVEAGAVAETLALLARALVLVVPAAAVEEQSHHAVDQHGHAHYQVNFHPALRSLALGYSLGITHSLFGTHP